MARKRFFRGPTGIYEPNLTPLIDVCLVLVVILLVATPMTLQSSISVSRATSSGKQGAATRAARIEITIRDDNNLTINRTPIPRDGFRDALRSMLATAQNRDVVVRCADGVSHGTFVSVLDEAKVEGAGRIAVVGR